MFDIIKAVIIGIVEGLTEFLPISSTGHIDLVNHVIKLSQSQDFINMFEYVIQFGAILAVILLYFNKLNPFSKPTAKARNATWQLWAKVIIAVLPSVVVGLPLNNWMDEHLHTPLVVATTLIIYGVLFIILENYLKNKKRAYHHSGRHHLSNRLTDWSFPSLVYRPWYITIWRHNSRRPINRDFSLRCHRIFLLSGNTDHGWRVDS